MSLLFIKLMLVQAVNQNYLVKSASAFSRLVFEDKFGVFWGTWLLQMLYPSYLTISYIFGLHVHVCVCVSACVCVCMCVCVCVYVYLCVQVVYMMA
jgi:hypothetical protein